MKLPHQTIEDFPGIQRNFEYLQTQPPASQARAYRSAAFTTTAGSFVKLPVDTASYDAGHNLILASSRYVCPVAGFYHIDAEAEANVGSPNANTWFQLGVAVNGVTRTYGSRASDADLQGYVTSTISDVGQCNAGDYVELMVGGNAAWPLVLAPTNNYMTIFLVS